MFASAVHQLRYAAGLLRGDRMPVESLAHIARDLVATVRQFGEPGDDAALLPGRQGATDPEVRRTVLTRGLRLTARRAATRTAYYQTMFADLGMRPQDLTLDSWTALPVTPKAALRGMPAAFVSVGIEPALLALTTGTSGTPTHVWLSRREVDMMVALNTISAVLGERLRPGDVLAYAGSSRGTIPVLCVSTAVMAVGATFMQLGTLDPEVALERLAAPLTLPGPARQITHLTANTSYLAALVSAAERGGWRAADFGLRSLQVGGEVLSDALRLRARQVFGVEPEIGYVLTESMPAGARLCSARHLHHTTEFAHVEVLDPVTYRPVAPGEIGTIVVTPLVPYRECTLLMRYVTGDLVRRLATPPTCELAPAPATTDITAAAASTDVAAVAATSDILGRYAGPLSLEVPHRQVLEVLDAEPDVALPARYALTPEPTGPVLHVLAEHRSPRLLARLEEAAATRGLPLSGIVLHDDLADMPATPPLRADLREHSFDHHPTPAAALLGAHP
ncbi:AMP-binding protein [Sphaerisporangium sp. NPDC051017]|uniref:phenylacetate--CoA ligase family protein n=1 Tax=Sphaerisporangium sp. NPDC051017 TaxID=3154636 RepID=UPI00344A5F18